MSFQDNLCDLRVLGGEYLTAIRAWGTSRAGRATLYPRNQRGYEGRRMDRRNFLGNLSWGSLALAGISSSGRATWKRPRFSAYPFSLGVASGDPLADGVVRGPRG